jgi:hypothetical protein
MQVTKTGEFERVPSLQSRDLVAPGGHYGFVDLTCRSALTGTDAGKMSVDIIILPPVDREQELPTVPSRLRRGWRLGGILLLSTGSFQSKTRLSRIQRSLADNHESGDFHDCLVARFHSRERNQHRNLSRGKNNEQATQNLAARCFA